MGPKNFYNAVDQRKLGTDKIDAIQNELDSMISLPPVTSEDEGKTMVVSDQGEWEVGTIDDLPPVTSEDAGKSLVVSDAGQWEVDSINSLPSVTSDDNDSMLEVVNGAWVKTKSIINRLKIIELMLGISGEILSHDFDFKTSAVDKIDGTTTATLTGTSVSNSGLYMTGSSKVVINGIFSVNKILQFKLGENVFNPSYSGRGTFIQLGGFELYLKITNDRPEGWRVIVNGTEHLLDISDANYFSYKNIIIETSNDHVWVYANENLIYDGTINITGSNLTIGGDNNWVFKNYYLEEIKVYTKVA